MRSLTISSPFGPARIMEEDDKIVGLDWNVQGEDEESPLLREAEAQLEAYFAKERRSFDLPLNPGGAGIQSVLSDLISKIPYGRTWTYEFLAGAAYNSEISQITRAVETNPIPIIVPCHRVIGDGHIGRYVGHCGVGAKMALLRLENPVISFANLKIQ